MSTVTTNDAVVTIKKELQNFSFRGEEFQIIYHYCMDNETEETFTTTELDELNLVQVHNQYRAKYGIPFVDEIKSIREQYGLSASKMSKVLGFGPNGYKNYENGEIPSIPHGRYLQLIKDPEEFMKLIRLNRNELQPTEWDKVNKKVNHRLLEYNRTQYLEDQFLFGDTTPSEFNGFRKPVLERIGALVAFFSGGVQPFTTKMNKLLFYADFLHYSRKGFGISGLNYIAITHGPVPKKYGTIYSALHEKGYFDIELIDFGDGIEGEKFVPSGTHDLEGFSALENDVLQEVMRSVGKVKTKTIVQISHDESAWKYNVNNKALISYQYGFTLQHV